MTDFYRFQNRYKITGIIKMNTPLSVGTRPSPLPTGSDLPVIKTPEGLPYIPGSSLKGVFRSVAEQILRTLDYMEYRWNGIRLWACDPLDDAKRCISPKNKEEMVLTHTNNGKFDDEGFTQEIWENSCTACRIFGSQWIASRIHFKDVIMVNPDEMIRLYEVRDGVGIDRDTGTAKPKLKFDFEVVPAGSKFALNIIAENVDDWEMGLILWILKAFENGDIPLGGKISRGLGWSRIEGLTIERVTADKIIDFFKGGIPEKVNPQDLINIFINGLIKQEEQHV